jgi:hypothetical protein
MDGAAGVGEQDAAVTAQGKILVIDHEGGTGAGKRGALL